ncbi:hypothetical protein K1X76_00635 [bacterium]|nr:hypothetical protein [bacterium]
MTIDSLTSQAPQQAALPLVTTGAVLTSPLKQNGDGYALASFSSLPRSTPPLLPPLFFVPQATPTTSSGVSDTDTGTTAPTCNTAVSLTSSWNEETFGYNATIRGQMVIGDIEKVIVALAQADSAGFKKIYPGIAQVTPNGNGVYTYFIHDTSDVSTYIGHCVKFTVTRKPDGGVTITRENCGPQPDKPACAGFMDYYTNFTSNRVTWDFTRIGDSSVFDVTCKVNSQSYFKDQTAAWGVSQRGQKMKIPFDTNLKASFARARTLFAGGIASS